MQRLTVSPCSVANLHNLMCLTLGYCSFCLGQKKRVYLNQKKSFIRFDIPKSPELNSLHDWKMIDNMLQLLFLLAVCRQAAGRLQHRLQQARPGCLWGLFWTPAFLNWCENSGLLLCYSKCATPPTFNPKTIHSTLHSKTSRQGGSSHFLCELP